MRHVFNHLNFVCGSAVFAAFPKTSASFLSFAFCAAAPPLPRVPFRPGPHAPPHGENAKATGKLLVLALRRSASGAAVLRAPHRRTRLSGRAVSMRAAFPSRPPCLPARASQDDASRKGKACQPSFVAKPRKSQNGMIFPRLMINLYHFCISVNDFLPCLLHNMAINRRNVRILQFRNGNFYRLHLSPIWHTPGAGFGSVGQFIFPRGKAEKIPRLSGGFKAPRFRGKAARSWE